MELNQKSRAAILAASGLALSALIGSLIYQSIGHLEPENELSVKHAVPSRANGAGSEAGQQVAPPGGSNLSLTAATDKAQAVAAARTDLGKTDPTAPLRFHEKTGRKANPLSGVEGGEESVMVPPPPPMAAGELSGRSGHTAGNGSVYDTYAGRKNIVLGDVKLVGIIDDKAVFTVPRKLARKLHYRNAFILSAGEKFNGVEVRSIGSDTAVISDGTRIAEKRLAPVR